MFPTGSMNKSLLLTYLDENFFNTSREKIMSEKRLQITITLGIYLVFTALFAVANYLMFMAEQNGTVEIMEPIAGMIMGFLMFPVFSIALPLWLARKWNLDFSFWPRGKNWLFGLAVIAVYIYLGQMYAITELVGKGIPFNDFAIHFISTTLFHISYYPLFAVLMLPVLRKHFGLATGLIVPALLFALFHLAGFYYFPGGLQPWMQVGLFAAFFVDLFIYLLSENLILVAIAHNISGSVGLAINGTVFNQVDEMLFVTAIIMVSLFTYMIIFEIRHKERTYNRNWWLRITGN